MAVEPPARPGPTDDELLCSGDPEDFGVFYRRHARTVLGYFGRRVDNPEVAADLTAETFAAAIIARRRYRPGRAPALAWLYGIAGHKLADYHRRGRAEESARRRLGMEHRALSTADVDLIRCAAEEVVVQVIDQLPSAERDAVRGHVIDERSYAELAGAYGTTEQVVRKRVSRGLARLRERAGGQR